jgi:hypothetical protein
VVVLEAELVAIGLRGLTNEHEGARTGLWEVMPGLVPGLAN